MEASRINTLDILMIGNPLDQTLAFIAFHGFQFKGSVKLLVHALHPNATISLKHDVALWPFTSFSAKLDVVIARANVTAKSVLRINCSDGSFFLSNAILKGKSEIAIAAGDVEIYKNSQIITEKLSIIDVSLDSRGVIVGSVNPIKLPSMSLHSEELSQLTTNVLHIHSYFGSIYVSGLNQKTGTLSGLKRAVIFSTNSSTQQIRFLNEPSNLRELKVIAPAGINITTDIGTTRGSLALTFGGAGLSIGSGVEIATVMDLIVKTSPGSPWHIETPGLLNVTGALEVNTNLDIASFASYTIRVGHLSVNAALTKRGGKTLHILANGLTVLHLLDVSNGTIQIRPRCESTNVCKVVFGPAPPTDHDERHLFVSNESFRNMKAKHFYLGDVSGE